MANGFELEPIFNPLLVDTVVNMLFEYLPLKDIINQRRVCKLWQRIGLTRLKNDIDKIQISFDPDKPTEKFLEMAEGFSFKFRNFAIRYLNDVSNDDANLQINRLLKEYGTHMKVIELNLCDSTNSWTFLSDVLVNKAPNVERMSLESYQRRSKAPGLFSGHKKTELKLKHLNLVWLDEANDPMYSLALLADIFAASPYLEGFRVFFSSENRMTLITDVHQMFAEKGNISNLKTLSLNVKDDATTEILATSFKSAPIERVSFHIHKMDLSMLANFETFFGDHKHTLKVLNIILPCVEFLKKVTFPTMNNLETLSINCCWCSGASEHEHRIPFGVYDFGKLFPNLLTVCLSENVRSQQLRFFNLYDMFPEDTTPVLTLKNLELPPISHPTILCRLGRIFPNVLKVEVVARTPGVLRELWTTWHKIKALNIWILLYPSFRRINLDSVFIGVDGSDHSRNVPSISQLRKLKHLRIGGYSYPSCSANVTDIRIKDETALFALAEMKELVSLHISEYCHEISSPCVQYLCSELGMLATKTEAGDKTLHLVKYEWQKLSCPSLLDYD